MTASPDRILNAAPTALPQPEQTRQLRHVAEQARAGRGEVRAVVLGRKAAFRNTVLTLMRQRSGKSTEEIDHFQENRRHAFNLVRFGRIA